jgi:hypothetical protein
MTITPSPSLSRKASKGKSEDTDWVTLRIEVPSSIMMGEDGGEGM